MSMEGIGGLFAFILGWFLAQSGKLIGYIISAGKPPKFRELVDCFTKSGGMPSGHTASFVSLTTYFIIKNGLFANITVLSIAMAIIVIYDAVNVRYAVGEQGKMINIMSEERKGKNGRKLRVVEGHTVPQAIVGGILGVLVGLFASFIL